MPITPLESTTASKGMQIAKVLLEQIKPALDQMNIAYDSDDGVKETVTQEELNEVASFSGITKAQLDDGMYVLTSTLREALNNGYSQLAQLSTRA